MLHVCTSINTLVFTLPALPSFHPCAAAPHLNHHCSYTWPPWPPGDHTRRTSHAPPTSDNINSNNNSNQPGIQGGFEGTGKEKIQAMIEAVYEAVS